MLAARHSQHSLELVREDLDEARGHIVPVVENPLGTAAGRQLQVRQQEISDDYHIRLVEQGLQIDGIEITPLLGKVSALVEDISGTAAHSSSEISAAGAEHQNDAVGHVLAAVVADTLNDRGRSGVADSKAFAGNSVEERFAAGRAVKGNVADEDIFFRSEAGSARRIHHESATGEALSNVIVGFALERKRDSLGEKRPQALTGRARKVNADGVVGQSGRAVTARDLTAEHASH